jgi:type II secretory pathway component PulF
MQQEKIRLNKSSLGKEKTMNRRGKKRNKQKYLCFFSTQLISIYNKNKHIKRKLSIQINQKI